MEAMTNEELIKAIRAGDHPEENIVRLYKQNQGLIYKTIRLLTGGQYGFIDDLMQESYFGLVDAVRTYQPEKGAFSTYLPWRIRLCVQRFRRERRPIKAPSHLWESLGKYRAYVSRYQEATGREPTPEDTREALGLTYEALKAVRVLEKSVLSIDEPIAGTVDLILSDTLADAQDDMQEAFEAIGKREAALSLWKAVDSLEFREREVIKGRYQKNQTFIQIGQALGLSDYQARNLEAKALQNLRRNHIVRAAAAAYGIGIRSANHTV